MFFKTCFNSTGKRSRCCRGDAHRQTPVALLVQPMRADEHVPPRKTAGFKSLFGRLSVLSRRSMKSAIATIIALSAISAAFAVTGTAYSDANCATLAANPILGVSNPAVAPLNVCTKSYTISGVTYYSKYSLCSATAATYIAYTDDKCTACRVAACTPTTDVPDKCLPQPDLAQFGINSIKVTCSSAGIASLAFFTVAAVVFAVFM